MACADGGPNTHGTPEDPSCLLSELAERYCGRSVEIWRTYRKKGLKCGRWSKILQTYRTRAADTAVNLSILSSITAIRGRFCSYGSKNLQYNRTEYRRPSAGSGKVAPAGKKAFGEAGHP